QRDALVGLLERHLPGMLLEQGSKRLAVAFGHERMTVLLGLIVEQPDLHLLVPLIGAVSRWRQWLGVAGAAGRALLTPDCMAFAPFVFLDLRHRRGHHAVNARIHTRGRVLLLVLKLRVSTGPGGRELAAVA